MPSLTAILDAEDLLRDSRATVDELAPGDIVVLHRAPAGEIVCTITYTAVVDSTTNTTPGRIHPSAWYSVTVYDLATSERQTFECGAKFSVYRTDDLAAVGATTLAQHRQRWAGRPAA